MKTLEIYFEFDKLKTNWRQEAIAGLTTVLTMAYIIVVNPFILADAGMNPAAVTRYPIAMDPGKGIGIPWETWLKPKLQALGYAHVRFFAGTVREYDGSFRERICEMKRKGRRLEYMTYG